MIEIWQERRFVQLFCMKGHALYSHGQHSMRKTNDQLQNRVHLILLITQEFIAVPFV
jgi:hypothetical protein